MSGAEKNLELAIIHYLRCKGHYCQKIPSGSIMKAGYGSSGMKMYRIKLADEGTPDIFACINGKFVGIEVKKDAKEQAAWERQWVKFKKDRILKKSWERSIVQHQQLDKILDSKGIVIVCSSIDELEKDLAELFPR